MTRFAIFTDLDGTLLDHETYSFEPARPVLERLNARGDVVVPVTSKTAAEIEHLVRRLGLNSPFVAENGCVLQVPPGYFREPVDARAPGCPERTAIVAQLHALRASHGFAFQSFTDMGVEGIVAATGLERAEAELANRRLASEPLLWNDTPERLETFVSLLAPHGLRITRGGRFVHVLGDADKGRAASLLLQRLRQHDPHETWTSVGLGDAPNDLPMLDVVDVAVVIPSARSFQLQPRAPRILRPASQGPTGWAEAVTQLLIEAGD